MNLRILTLLALSFTTSNLWAHGSDSKVKAQIGDYVVFTGTLAINRSQSIQHSGGYEVLVYSDVFIKPKGIGPLISAEIQGPLYASPSNMEIASVIEEGRTMTYGGTLSYAGHVMITEVVSHEGADVSGGVVADVAESDVLPGWRPTRVPGWKIFVNKGSGDDCKAILNPEMRDKLKIVHSINND